MLRTLILALAAAILVAAVVPAQRDLYDETVLRTLELTFKQSDWQQQLASNYASKTYIKADLKVDGITFTDIGVRYRGNSSYKAVQSIKKPFKIKLDAFGGSDDLYGYRTLNLNNGFRDPGFVREVLAYRLFRRIEPASKANWVKLVINGTSYGVYINVEQINQDLLGAWFEDVDGLRYRGERGPSGTVDDPAFKWLGTIASEYRKGYELKNGNPVNPWVNLIETCRVLNQTATSQLHTAVPKILDVDECIRYLAGNNLLPAMDSYIGGVAHNFYVYEDPHHKRTAVMPWDLNAAFGANNALTVAQKQALDPFYLTTRIHRPLLSRVIVEPEWRQRYLAHMRAMLVDFYDWKFIGPIVTRYQKLIQSEVQKDQIKLYPYTQFATTITQDVTISVKGRIQWIPGLKPMIERRRAYLLGRADFQTIAPMMSGLTRKPAVPKDLDTVWITARVTSGVGLQWVKLYWRAVGPYHADPMYDDGQHGDGGANDGVWGAAIPRQNLRTKIEYYVGARSNLTQGGAMAFLPSTAGHLPPNYSITELSTKTPVVVNELLADNKTTDQDNAGDYDDWAEIHNTSNSPVAIAGYYLSDDVGDHKKWQFPAGTTIAAGGFLRAWLDNEPNEGRFHATFRLDNDGEAVVLSDASGRILDIVEFDEQKTDRSFGRLPDGGGRRYFLWTPSGGAPALGSATGKALMFDARRTGSESGFDLVSVSVPKVGNILNLHFLRGPSNSTAILGIALGNRSIDLGAIGPLLIDPSLMVTLPVTLDQSGFAGLSAPIPASTAGFTAYFQAAAHDLSNGLAVRFTN